VTPWVEVYGRYLRPRTGPCDLYLADVTYRSDFGLSGDGSFAMINYCPHSAWGLS